MSTLKRALSSDATDAQPSKKLATDTASSDAQLGSSLSQLDAVLRLNVFPFLSTRDAAVLLSCSTALRHDTELAALALETGPARLFADHFGTVCGSNWFHLESTRCPSGEVLSDDCDHGESDESDSDDDEEEDDDDDNDDEEGESDSEDAEAEAHDEGVESSNADEGDGNAKEGESGSEGGEVTDEGEDDEGEGEGSSVDDEEEGSSDEEGDDDDDEADRPQASAQLLSLIGAFKTFILPATLPEDICITPYADNVFPVPVAVSLWDHHPTKQTLKGGHKWTREDVRLALNDALDGLGDRFSATDPVDVHATEVGAHWESIQQPAKSGAAPCSLCEKATYLQVAFDATKDGEHAALTALQASAAGRTYTHCERAVAHHASPAFDESDTPFEALLESDDVGILAPPLSHFDFSTVATAVGENYSVPDVCRAFVQPLKQFLLQHCQFVHRIEFPVPHGHDLQRWHGETSAELLAGVTPSGYLCGAFLTRVQS